MTRRWGPPHRDHLAPIPGGVTAPAGFVAGAATAGLKDSGRPDVAVIASLHPAAAAMVTTTNQVQAAPNVLSARHLEGGAARGVLVNAGSANACTGDRGFADAERSAAALARALEVPTTETVVLSTGIIGVPLDVDRLVAAVPVAVADATVDGSARAEEAIATTDTVRKRAAYEVADETGTCRIGGIAKGAGMIEPAMATMLAVVTTDAPVAPPVLRFLTQQAAERTFNRISVDACGSTNDAVVVLANGVSDAPPGLPAFQAGLEAVFADLAYAIVADGEGAERVGVVTVRGAVDGGAAEDLARAICRSTLVRAALHGADPNWGRILAAMGASPTRFEPSRVAISWGGVTVCRFGSAAVYDPGQAALAADKPEVEIVVDLGLGSGEATMLTAELSPAYVAENAYYTT